MAKSASSSSAYSAGSSAAPSRLSSTSRSPGTPTASSSHSPPGTRVLSITFFSVSAAVTSRSSAVLAHSTSVAIVGVPGVSYTLASGWPSIGSDSGTAVVTASTLAAYPDSIAAHERVLADVAFGQELL